MLLQRSCRPKLASALLAAVNVDRRVQVLRKGGLRHKLSVAVCAPKGSVHRGIFEMLLQGLLRAELPVALLAGERVECVLMVIQSCLPDALLAALLAVKDAQRILGCAA